MPGSPRCTTEAACCTGAEYAIAWPTDQVFRQSGPIAHYSHVGYYYDDTTDWRTKGFSTVVMNFTGRIAGDPGDFKWTGHIWGTFHMKVDDPCHGNGAREGTWTDKMVDGVPYIKTVAHGSGVLDGLQLKTTGYGIPDGGPIMLEGRILEPHGK